MGPLKKNGIHVFMTGNLNRGAGRGFSWIVPSVVFQSSLQKNFGCSGGRLIFLKMPHLLWLSSVLKILLLPTALNITFLLIHLVV